MKKAIPILTVTAIMCITSLLPVDLFAQSSEGYLMVRVFESRDKAYNKIVVTENGAKVEEIEIEPFNYKDMSIPQIEINKILDKYVSEGYNLSKVTCGSTTASNNLLGILVTTYLFKKE